MKAVAVLVLFAAVLLASVTLGAPDARAQADASGQVDDVRRVVVLVVDGDAQLTARLAAELRSQGFEPVDATVEADLALRVERSPTAIRLSIANAVTGRKIQREAPIAEGAPPDSAIVSLWAVEALRASLVAPAAPPRSEVVAAPAPPSPPERRVALHIGSAVTSGPGGMGPAAEVLLGARLALAGGVGGELFTSLPTVPTRLERASGTATVSRGLAAVGAYLSAGRNEARWSAQLGAGAALTVVRVSGSGSDGYVGRVDQVTAGGPYVRLGAAARLSRAFRLRLDGMAGALFPQPTIFFAGERVAAWGRPWLAAALSGEVTF
jgi:hypothetical protein